ncbi:hypothetical protein EYZ11_009461 [Aspergillus tanneri]|uniref:DUF676 domain-containing protein n=1 Tax=Aspergillus tanneri TaxID=1220188 RepID=A0A4S3J7V3_9EURO|nr:uncharacterized protein ATNIH1004_000803 [Aspergillus tanneri]KAA8651904.1 hypothetical protein ATNIH1004_000803 [Aspergillus tanneri]THC91076.1 hypothetical protein EYZ11_009461 [Aspergillus tanneri]
MVVYPKYETRGNLKDSVCMFREWLQNQVIDLEVANRTASPTVDPSVHVFLVGHSMGGIVAAETLLLLASEQPIPPKPSHTADLLHSGTADNSHTIEPGSFMFPHIQGVLAFDTPFLGIAPGVVSYGAEGHYRSATSAYNTLSEVAGLFGIGGGNSSSGTGVGQQREAREASSSQSASNNSSTDAAATPSWQRWGRYAMFAGAAGAVAAGGAAAMYSQRERLTDGWGWVSSHIAFVGCLVHPSELRQRLGLLSKVHEERGIGCINFFTCLGQGATSLIENPDQANMSFSQKIIRSKHRTFCTLPPEIEGQDMKIFPAAGLTWVRASNDKAGDEVKAHVTMFSPKDNPAFDELANDTCKALVKSIDKAWYSSATTSPVEEMVMEMPRTDDGKSPSAADSRFMDGDDVVVVD